MDRHCEYCQRPFEIYRRPDQRFCDPECRNAWKAQEAKEARALLKAKREQEQSDGHE